MPATPIIDGSRRSHGGARRSRPCRPSPRRAPGWSGPCPLQDGVADPEAMVQQVVDVDPLGDDVAPVFARREVDPGLGVDVGNRLTRDQRDLAGVGGRVVARPVEVPVAAQATAGDRLDGVDRFHRLRTPSGDEDVDHRRYTLVPSPRSPMRSVPGLRMFLAAAGSELRFAVDGLDVVPGCGDGVEPSGAPRAFDQRHGSGQDWPSASFGASSRLPMSVNYPHLKRSSRDSNARLSLECVHRGVSRMAYNGRIADARPRNHRDVVSTTRR